MNLDKSFAGLMSCILAGPLKGDLDGGFIESLSIHQALATYWRVPMVMGENYYDTSDLGELSCIDYIMISSYSIHQPFVQLRTQAQA